MTRRIGLRSPMNRNCTDTARVVIVKRSPKFFSIFCLVLLTCVGMAAILLGAQQTDGTPRVVFTKEFPNSQPDYYSVIVYENGRATYKSAPDNKSPVEFQLPSETAAEIFQLAGKLNWFKDRKIESGRRVANMGKKTFAFAKGEELSEASFNHTEIPEAVELASMFEKISQTNEHLLRLKNMIRFDRLGVVKELLRIEADLDAGRLLGAGQLLPILEQIQKDRSLVNVAKERAVQILGKIQTGKD